MNGKIRLGDFCCCTQHYPKLTNVINRISAALLIAFLNLPSSQYQNRNTCYCLLSGLSRQIVRPPSQQPARGSSLPTRTVVSNLLVAILSRILIELFLSDKFYVLTVFISLSLAKSASTKFRRIILIIGSYKRYGNLR